MRTDPLLAPLFGCDGLPLLIIEMSNNWLKRDLQTLDCALDQLCEREDIMRQSTRNLAILSRILGRTQLCIITENERTGLTRS